MKGRLKLLKRRPLNESVRVGGENGEGLSGETFVKYFIKLKLVNTFLEKFPF